MKGSFSRYDTCPNCGVPVMTYKLPCPDDEGFIKCPVCQKPSSKTEWVKYSFKVEDWE